MIYFTSENLLFVGSILIFTSILISKAGFRFGLPSLLLFLLVGMLFGSDGLGLQFDNVRQAQFVGIVALCVILFTGGLETKIKEIKPVLAPGLALSTIGVILTTALTGGFVYLISGWDKIPIALPLVTCLLMAATMSSTDSAAVFNLLRGKNVNLKNNLKPVLELESGSNDPMAYILTIMLIQVATDISAAGAGDTGTWKVVSNALLVLLMQFGAGAGTGLFMGYLSVRIINRINLRNTPLYAIMLLSIVFFTFSIAGFLHGNGYLAVYIAGIVIGNHKITNTNEISSFLYGMTWLMQIRMFHTRGLLGTADRSVHDADSASRQRIPHAASVQENKPEIKDFHLLGRTPRSSTDNIRHLSGHRRDTRFRPDFQHSLLHHPAVSCNPGHHHNACSIIAEAE